MSYNVNSFVNKDEANALKEMIFKRATERARALSADVQTDIMDVARESFVSKNNPFSQIVQEAAEKTQAVGKAAPAIEKTEIGFPQRQLKARAVEQSRVVNEQLTVSAVQNNMNEARKALSNKKSFMCALDFLNSQAAVSLMRTKSDNFEAVV